METPGNGNRLAAGSTRVKQVHMRAHQTPVTRRVGADNDLVFVAVGLLDPAVINVMWMRIT